MAIDKFLVEASHIMMFARSVGDANPIYHDEEYAKGTDLGAIIAPPIPAWYTNPKTIDDIIDFIVVKLFDLLDEDLINIDRWKGPNK